MVLDLASVLGTIGRKLWGCGRLGRGRGCYLPRAHFTILNTGWAFPTPQEKPEIQLFYLNSPNLKFKHKEVFFGRSQTKPASFHFVASSTSFACGICGSVSRPCVAFGQEAQSQWHYQPCSLDLRAIIRTTHTYWSSWHCYLGREVSVFSLFFPSIS